MKSKKYIMESDQRIVVKVIGDYIANLIDNSDSNLTSDVRSRNMTISNLVGRLKTEDVHPETDYVFLSIGTEEYFSNDQSVNMLCDLIYDIYPNAKYYVIEGFLSMEDANNFDEDEYDDIEQQRFVYYNEFKKNRFKVIRTNVLFSDETIEPNSTEILNFRKEISLLTTGDVNLIGGGSKMDDGTNLTIHHNVSLNNGDDETDFDTIYEFINRFEKIVKSKNVYSINTGSKYDPNIHQIEIALRFLLPNYVSDFKSDGVFDRETEDAIRTYQVSRNFVPTGIADPETIEEIFYDLKIDGFDDDDLGKFLNDIGKTETEDEVYMDGEVDYSNVGLDSTQSANVQLMIDYMNQEGITNPYTQIGILSCIGKECGFNPQSEICYDGTPNADLRSLFDCRLRKYDEPGLTELKKDCEDFFEAIYGVEAQHCFNWSTGNDSPGDGYNYRGRGFNQLTFKSNYKTYGNIIGEDLVSDPDKLNEPDVAAKVAVAFLTNGSSVPEFDDKRKATDYFVNANNSGARPQQQNFDSAYTWMDKFEVVP